MPVLAAELAELGAAYAKPIERAPSVGAVPLLGRLGEVLGIGLSLTARLDAFAQRRQALGRAIGIGLIDDRRLRAVGDGKFLGVRVHDAEQLADRGESEQRKRASHRHYEPPSRSHPLEISATGLGGAGEQGDEALSRLRQGEPLWRQHVALEEMPGQG